MDNRDIKVLRKLYDIFTGEMDEDSEFEIRLLEKEESGLEADLLTTLHRSFGTISNMAEGDFFFDDDVFVARILICAEINTDNLPTLCVLISMINSDIPVGSFEYDPTENVIAYSLKTPVTESMTLEEVTELADRCVAMALSVSEQYSSDLIENAH